MATDAPTPDGYPADSWWLNATQFYALAKRELGRMRRSRYGRTETVTTARDVERVKPETPQHVDQSRALTWTHPR